MLEKTPKSPLDSRGIKPVDLKGNQPWLLIGRTDAEAEALVFWSPDVNSQLTGKVLDAEKDWGEKKRASEDEMVRDREAWHAAFPGVTKSQTQIGDWKTTTTIQPITTILKERDFVSFFFTLRTLNSDIQWIFCFG